LLAFSSRFKTAAFSARAEALPERPARGNRTSPLANEILFGGTGESIATPHENYLNENFQ